MEKKRILIVDDQMDWRLLVRMSLEGFNVEIIEADDGQKGINLAESANPDLIIMDNNMPVLSGYEAIKQIKSKSSSRSVPIIMLTSKGFDKQMKEMIMLDINEFISKPFEEDKLIAAIEKIIGKLPAREEKPATEEVPIGKKILMLVRDSSVKAGVLEAAGPMNKVTEVTTKSELLARAKEAKPDCIIADVGLVNWQDDTGSEIIGLAITGNIPMIFDFSQVQNENLKKILESRGTTLAEFKIALIEKVLNEE